MPRGGCGRAAPHVAPTPRPAVHVPLTTGALTSGLGAQVEASGRIPLASRVLYSTAMRGSFTTVALLLVVGLVLSAPLAWASGNCAAMGGTCEGPCGAASCATFGVPAGPGLPFIGNLVSQDADDPPSAIPALLELPPRSSLLSA